MHVSWYGLHKFVQNLMTHVLPAWFDNLQKSFLWYHRILGPLSFQVLPEMSSGVEVRWQRSMKLGLLGPLRSSSGYCKVLRRFWGHHSAAVWIFLHKDANQRVQHICVEEKKRVQTARGSTAPESKRSWQLAKGHEKCSGNGWGTPNWSTVFTKTPLRSILDT